QREASPAIVEPLRIELLFLEDQFQKDTPPESPMADNRTMAELLQAPSCSSPSISCMFVEITYPSNTIEGNFCLEIRRINTDLEKFYLCLKEEMIADLRYFNSLELEVDSLKSQLGTQKT
nr:hypothetical protein [Tanacetum cinerariifolium]